jgi:hypothetical protein
MAHANVAVHHKKPATSLFPPCSYLTQPADTTQNTAAIPLRSPPGHSVPTCSYVLTISVPILNALIRHTILQNLNRVTLFLGTGRNKTRKRPGQPRVPIRRPRRGCRFRASEASKNGVKVGWPIAGDAVVGQGRKKHGPDVSSQARAFCNFRVSRRLEGCCEPGLRHRASGTVLDIARPGCPRHGPGLVAGQGGRPAVSYRRT